MRYLHFEKGDYKLELTRDGGEGEGRVYALYEFGERDDHRPRVGEQFKDNEEYMWEVLLVISGRLEDLRETRVGGYVNINMDKSVDGDVIAQFFLYNKASVDPNTIGTVVVVKPLGKS